MADIDPTALIRKLAPLCREQGIRRVRVGEVEIELGPAVADPTKGMAAFANMIEQGLPTEDEALNWSAPGWNPPPPKEPGPPKHVRGRRS